MQKGRIVIGTALALALGAATVGAVGTANAQMYGQGYGMMGPGYGPGMMGPGMMGPGYGPGMMGPGMMGPGYGPGMMGPGMMYGQGYGPGMMGPGMMGPGMMQGQGYGPGMMGPGMMGPGMMGPGYGPGMMYGHGYGGRGPGWFRNQGNLNISPDDAKNYFERWIAIQGNSRLKVGDVKEKDADTVTVDIVTKDNSLVQRFEVNRHNGSFQQVEG